MTQKRRYNRRKKDEPVGQADIFGTVHGLDKLVVPPEVISEDGMSVIHYVVTEADRQIPGYMDEVKTQARKLLPEAKSVGKPPWMKAEWQAKRRKRAAGYST